jgi:hypothetical protein
MEVELQVELFPVGAGIDKFNVIGPLIGITEKGVEKIIGAFSRKELLQGLGGKKGVNG